MSGLRVLYVADSDSQLIACEALAGRFPAEMGVASLAVPKRRGINTNLLQRVRYQWHLIRDEPLALIAGDHLNPFDAIGVFLTGSAIADFRFFYRLHCCQKGKAPALLFCGFNGVVLGGFEEAILWRLGYDVICLNGERDRQAFMQLTRHTPFASQPVLVTGLLRPLIPPSIASESGGIGGMPTVVFAEQVAIPDPLPQRQRLLRKLAALAARSPDWQLLIRPRVRWGEQTFHAVREPVQRTLRQAVRNRPHNLRISHLPMSWLLNRAAGLLTVSSTAIFDALAADRMAAVVVDLGISAELGTDTFLGSGLNVHLDRLDHLSELRQLQPNPDWLAWMGHGGPDTEGWPERLAAMVQARQPPLQDAEAMTRGSAKRWAMQAEAWIQLQNWHQAAECLERCRASKPEHRGHQKRWQAVQQPQHWRRRWQLLWTWRWWTYDQRLVEMLKDRAD